MNVLLTCAGRRSYSVEIFKQAVRPLGYTVACDSSGEAPALQIADRAFTVPPVDDPTYIDALLSICEAHDIDLLVPALEPELLLLAAERARFLDVGTMPLVSSPEVVTTCYDKLATGEFLAPCGVSVPRTFESLEAARAALSADPGGRRLVVKPRWGVSSIGLHFAEDDEELELSYRLARKQVSRSLLAQISATDAQRSILIQERLVGDEYGLDVINNLSGTYVCTLVKRKLRMRAGQTDRAVTVRDERLEMIGRVIGENLGHVGPLDCDAFVTPQGCYVIDMNPRIGGGYPFSHVAGANLPAALVAWADGRRPDPACFQMEPNVMASRDDTLVVINQKQIVVPCRSNGKVLQEVSQAA
ncbi:MAG: ATP-grasp domain-containing protein [Verrucomicrobia bacterium]|nr:ATP-grasp domain-containing protein [Verrucomicrobiota bacterium]